MTEQADWNHLGHNETALEVKKNKLNDVSYEKRRN